MELKGTIVKVMEIVTGQSGKGAWMKQEFVLQVPGQFPKNVCMSLWGEDKINKYDLAPGLTVTAHIELESREYNGRWYTDVRAWKMEWDAQASRKWQNGGESKTEASLSESSRASEHSTTTDDLPF